MLGGVLGGTSICLAGPTDLWATGNDGTQLIRIDSTSGATTTYAAHGYGQTWAAGFTPDGTLWTLVNGFSGNAVLGTFNKTTGAITTVGSGVGTNMICLDADNGGTMYGVGYSDRQLYQINTVTGSATALGDTGISSMMDIAFDASGTLWAVNSSGNLWTINTANGASTFIASLSGGVAAEMGLAVDSSGQFFLTEYLASPGLWTLNENTGASALVGGIASSYTHGADFEPGQIIPLPSASIMKL